MYAGEVSALGGACGRQLSCIGPVAPDLYGEFLGLCMTAAGRVTGKEPAGTHSEHGQGDRTPAVLSAERETAPDRRPALDPADGPRPGSGNGDEA